MTFSLTQRGLWSNDGHDVPPYAGKLDIKASLQLFWSEAHAAVACVPTPVLQPKIAIGNGAEFCPFVDLVVADAMRTRVNRPKARQYGIDIVQGRVKDRSHRPIAERVLVGNLIKLFIMPCL